MAIMSKYCKAYPLDAFGKYAGWTPESALGPGTNEVGPSADVDRGYAFLHDNFTVTKNVFVDEQIVFNQVTPPWIEFCRTQLGFEPPHEEDAALSTTPEPLHSP